MIIIVTLKEVLNKTNDWEKFCEDFSFSEWAVKMGGGDIEVTLTEQEANKYGLLNVAD